ncbi:MAG: CoA transferase [Haloglomus sp.]
MAFLECTVLEVGEYVSVPYAGKLFADLGADVIKLERPRGDVARRVTPFADDEPGVDRSEFFGYLNTGKRSVVLPRTPSLATDFVHDLVEAYDVDVVLADTLDEFGLDPAAVSRAHDGVSVVSVTGFGATGPWQDYDAPDVVAWAESGHMNKMGYPDSPPTRPRIKVADYWAGQVTAMSAMAALLASSLQGQDGQYVDVSRREAGLSTMDRFLAGYSWTGETSQRSGYGYPEHDGQPARKAIYRAADGYVSLITKWDVFCTEFLDRPELVDDERFETRGDRMDNIEAVTELVVRRAELDEDGPTTRDLDADSERLARHCRVGGAVASAARRRGIDGAHETLSGLLGADRVHLVRFTGLEQPVLNGVLLECVKDAIADGLDTGAGTGRVVVGSSPSGVLYLGEAVDRAVLREAVGERAPRRIESDFEFECKLNWNSFDYDVLAEVDIPTAAKERSIADAFRRLLERGSAGVEPIERVPEAFDRYLPTLAKSIYVDGSSEFDDEAVQRAYDRIEREQGVQKVKLHFLAYLVRHADDHRSFLDAHAEDVRPALHRDLDPESNVVGTAVDRFFEDSTVSELGSKDEMCFLCGSAAETKYQKGMAAIYRTQAYSRRVPPHAKYKSICGVCNLEYALLSDVCERSDVSTNNDVEVAYLYFDDFLGDLRLRPGRGRNLVQGDGDGRDDPDVRRLLGSQYQLQPVYVLDDNHRMAVVRQVMETARTCGAKAVVGRPFTRFEGADDAFVDREATRLQARLGLARSARFGPGPSSTPEGDDSHLDRAIQLFRIVSVVGQEANLSNPYLRLDRDTFHSVADFAVANHDHAARLHTLRSYFERYHESELMDMRTVAERGIDLFGQRHGSRYRKTRLFREALDAFLDGKSQRMDDADVVDYVQGQVYAAADRTDYARHAAPDEVEAFVDAVRSYLVDNDLYDVTKLSDWEDALVNSYYYAYEQARRDR